MPTHAQSPFVCSLLVVVTAESHLRLELRAVDSSEDREVAAFPHFRTQFRWMLLVDDESRVSRVSLHLL